jgi:ketosteroid isomerase-like protein
MRRLARGRRLGSRRCDAPARAQLSPMCHALEPTPVALVGGPTAAAARAARSVGLELDENRSPPRDTAQAMGQQDEEIVARLRRFYDAFNRGDYHAATEVAHPAIEFVRALGESSLHGTDALREWMRPDAFVEQQIEGLEFRVNENKVLVRSHAHGRGAGSGIDVHVDFWSVWTLSDDGLATRLEFYLDDQEAEALEAAGLRE